MRGMRGNKTLQAVQRSPSSYGQKEFCVHFDRDCDIPPDSICHTHACTTEDVTAMITIIQPTKLISFPHTFKSPTYNRVDISKKTVFLPYWILHWGICRVIFHSYIHWVKIIDALRVADVKIQNPTVSHPFGECLMLCPQLALHTLFSKIILKSSSYVIKMRSMCRQSVIFCLIKWCDDELALSQNKLR